MHDAIESLRNRLDFIPDGRYLAALSGGADSTALLYMLLPDIRSGRLQVTAVHVNHGLRGAESDGDERFVAALCRREGVPLISRRVDLAGRRDEDAARKARFSAFLEATEEESAGAVILAHHADDQAETFLMRLLRGAGTTGLSCMKSRETAFGITLIRPMLSLRREEIREALRKDGIPWREDSSNLETDYLRNRIRQQLLPEMNRLAGDAVGRICGAVRRISEDDELLNREAAELTGRLAEGERIDAEALREVPAALRGRTLRMWWRANAPERKEHALSERQTAGLAELALMKRGKMNLPGGMFAVRGARYLHLTGSPVPPAEPVQVSFPKTRFGGYILKVSASEGSPGDGKRTQEVPAGFADGCEIRTRRPGDRIRPFGSAGSRKLQDYLTDRHVDEPFRDRIPLLCRGNEVLLVCGVGAGGIPAWTGEADSVRLTWSGDMPWMD